MKHTRASLSQILIFAIFCTLFSPYQAFAESADAEQSRARQTASRALQDGDRLRDAGQCQEAIATYRAGLRAVAHWVFLARIGVCYARLGRHEMAAAYLRRALESAGSDLTDDLRQQLARDLERSLVALEPTLDVATNVGDVEILVDGQIVGQSPLDHPLDLSAGQHTVEARREGFQSASAQVVTQPGERAFVFLELQQIEIPQQIPIEDDPLPENPRRRRARIWGGVLIGLGVVLAGGGTTFAVLDGRPFGDGNERVELDSLGPGVLISTLGVGLLAGGISLLVAPPGRP